MPNPTILIALVVLVIAVVGAVNSWRQPVFWVWLCIALLALIPLWDPVIEALG